MIGRAAGLFVLLAVATPLRARTAGLDPDALAGLIKAKRYEELPTAVALARLLGPRDAVVSRAARIRTTTTPG